MSDDACCGNEVDVETADVQDNGDFEETVSAVGLAAFEVRGKLKDIQSICGDGCKAVPASVLEENNLSKEVVESGR